MVTAELTSRFRFSSSFRRVSSSEKNKSKKIRNNWIELHEKIRLLNRYLGFKGSLKTRYLNKEPCWLSERLHRKSHWIFNNLNNQSASENLCKFNDLGERSEKAIWSGKTWNFKCRICTFPLTQQLWSVSNFKTLSPIKIMETFLSCFCSN